MPDEKSQFVQHDNLKVQEGTMESRKEYDTKMANWKEGKLKIFAENVHRSDTLKVEGEFAKKEDIVWLAGERAHVLRRKDTLFMEGEMEGRKVENWLEGKRPDMLKREDTLQIDGEFAKREQEEWKMGERSHPVTHQDNLKSEGNSMHYKRI